MKINYELKKKIEERIGTEIISSNSVSGGCIGNACKLKTTSGKNYFLKFNDFSLNNMFIKEANGLSELSKANAIRVPDVILAEKSFILLEHIEIAHPGRNFFENFGRKFAGLHKYNSDSFGFFEDNYIGSTDQINIPAENGKGNWTEFYWNKRILFQYKLAEKNGYVTSELQDGIKKLESKIVEILSGSEEKPALLHGDLWSGNYMSDENGNACLIDPAVYYGHREADLAMTKLFGGFDNKFYSAYNEANPLKDGWRYRENIYKLYHVLNHLNLFGRGYYSHAVALIKSYL
ncbi:MAG: fructosamine kinase family protein [Ignavibacteriaceae bacterium]